VGILKQFKEADGQHQRNNLITKQIKGAKMIPTPRPYQIEAEQSIWDYYNSGKTGNALIAIPTGCGKSLVIAWFAQHVMEQYPQSRIIVLTHVKELIKQNSDKLAEIWPTAPFGIYSAGLKKKQHTYPIIFGGIGTVVNSLDALGRFDLMLVDEAHLMSGNDDSMYGKAVNTLKERNAYLKVIGFTATPYRTGQGLLTQSGLFTDIVCDFTSLRQFNKLIDDGYMCMLIPKRTNTQLDVSKVPIRNGDYAKTELEQAIDHHSVTYNACRETIELGSDRNCWLVFASGIKHAEHIAEMFTNFGIPCKTIHSKLDSTERDKRIEDFRKGIIRCAVTNNILTTGFDHPPIDLIVMMRPTVSTGLWVQMLGRGTRPSAETAKTDCLVLDFAGNTVRLGPINDPVIPKPRKAGAPGVAPIRICDNCGVYNHASASVCFNCGMEFPRQVHIEASAGTDELVRTELPVVQQFRVNKALYSKFASNGFNILRVNYVCGIRDFSEIVCLEHPGRAGGMAVQWWKHRMGSDKAPPNVDEALVWVSQLAVPQSVWVDVNRKYPKVVKTEF
jgi:DNA repair protein RadD